MASARTGLREVAKRAGVSLGTASNALAGRPRVAPGTRAAVLAAADELGYRARPSPPSLATRVEMIGLIIRHGLPIVTNPFYSHVLHGAQAACAAHGIGLTHEMVAPLDRGVAPLPLMLRQRRVDGIVVVGYVEPAFLMMLRASEVPFVLVDHQVRPAVSDSVRGDDEEGAYLATRHLIDAGHREPAPAAILGPLLHASLRDRFAGYRRALAEAGLALDPAAVRVDDSGGRCVPDAVAALLALPTRPTAIFCANDQIAIETLTALRARGVEAPADCSVVGYDDIAWAAHATPPLTTIRVDKELLGAQGVRALLERIEDRGMPPRETRLGVALIERASVRRRADGA